MKIIPKKKIIRIKGWLIIQVLNKRTIHHEYIICTHCVNLFDTFDT